MKWIILAWWSWTRLYPLTLAISKQLMPIYDKPMIYYPLSTLMLAWIKDILIITTPKDNQNFQCLLWDWKKWGINISYCIQLSPDWLAQSFILWKNFIWNDNVCLILWDNLFYWNWLKDLLVNSKNIVEKENKSVIFWYKVQDPQRYWVVEFDKHFNAISIEEKPKIPKSNFAVVWLYFYTNEVVNISKNIMPSKRWELEITDVNKEFLFLNKLKVELMDSWYAWLDTWTHDSMLGASNFVEIIEKRQWIKIWSPEEISFRNWRISKSQLTKLASDLIKSNYWNYLLNLIK